MAPNSVVVEDPVPQSESKIPEYKQKILWFNVIFFIYLHVGSLYAIYLIFSAASWKTTLFAIFYANVGGLGITAGPHRLWSHRSYKAKFPLRALLCCMFTIAGQRDIFDWCRDHRVHHKFTETDADPHNIKRGFFFAHIGWLMCQKHPDVIKKGKTVFLDDILADPIVKFHRRYYLPMFLFFCVILPTMIPVWYWNETVWNSFFIAGVARYCYIQNAVWLVNSAAHQYGNRPYDKHIEARENYLVAFLGLGEGWHNFHHAFPWDYATGELGNFFNFTKKFIDFMAWTGQAYDLKQAQPEMVKNKKKSQE